MPLGILSTDEMITLKWILWKNNRREWTGFIWLRMRMSGGPLLNMVLNLQISSNAGNFLTNRECISFSRRTRVHGICVCLFVCLLVS